MSTLTTPNQGSARAHRAVGGVCSARVRVISGSSWRRVAVSPVFGFGGTGVDASMSHLTMGTTNPVGHTGYPSIKRPARHLGTRST